MRIQVYMSPPGYDYGPDYFPYEYSAFEHRFDNSFPSSSGAEQYVFWIYDYSNSMGTNLQNFQSKVLSGEIPVFHNGVIPHEDTTGIPSGRRWHYRWISNKWKYAPWERYPSL